MSGGAGSESHGEVSRLCSSSQHCSVGRDEEGVADRGVSVAKAWMGDVTQ